MGRESVVFNEAQAIEQLAREEWVRHGRALISKHGYTPSATAQLTEPLTSATRDAMRLRTEPTGDGYHRFVASARHAESFLAEHGFAPNVVPAYTEHSRGR